MWETEGDDVKKAVDIGLTGKSYMPASVAIKSSGHYTITLYEQWFCTIQLTCYATARAIF